MTGQCGKHIAISRSQDGRAGSVCLAQPFVFCSDHKQTSKKEQGKEELVGLRPEFKPWRIAIVVEHTGGFQILSVPGRDGVQGRYLPFFHFIQHFPEVICSNGYSTILIFIFLFTQKFPVMLSKIFLLRC